MSSRNAILLSAIVLASVGIGISSAKRLNESFLDHFDVVKPGILYRSGQLTPGQLRQVIEAQGIRTLVNLQHDARIIRREAEISKELGVDYLSLPMPGDGYGREDQFREFLKACDDPKRRPVLVHCARGTCRTGAAVAFYRFERDGWSIEDVSAEMRRHVYREGTLPGYVFGLTKNRPPTGLESLPTRFEENRREDAVPKVPEVAELPQVGLAEEPRDVH